MLSFEVWTLPRHCSTRPLELPRPGGRRMEGTCSADERHSKQKKASHLSFGSPDGWPPSPLGEPEDAHHKSCNGLGHLAVLPPGGGGRAERPGDDADTPPVRC
jgi:hypothetical protein